MNRHRGRWAPPLVMWTTIGASMVVLGVLLALGWDGAAWTTAAAVLLLACVATCIFAGVQGRNTDREVRRAIARLAAAREANERRRALNQETTDGR